MLGPGDPSLRKDALDALVAQSEAQDSMDIESMTADSAPPIHWLGAVGSLPFLSDRRIFVVRNLGRVAPSAPGAYSEHKAGKDHPFVREALALPPTSRLILVADDEAGSEDVVKRRADAALKWRKLVELAGGQYLNFEAKPAEVAAMAREEAKRLGKSMSASAAQTLVDMTAARPALALAEIAKLALYVGDAPEITERDVRQSVAEEMEYSIWQLADAVMSGQSGQALAHFDRLRGKHAKLEEQAFSSIFPVLMNQIRVLWQARAAHEGRGAEGGLDGRGSLSSLPDWRREKAMRSARSLSFPKLAACIQAIHEADAEIKGILDSASTRESLEQMILRMARACAR